jgi:DNA-binding MarR family transcriptional regulator
MKNHAMGKPPVHRNGDVVQLGMLSSLLGYHLRRAQLSVFHHFSATMEQVDITPGQFGMLEVIDGNPGLSQTQLGAALGIDRSTVVAMIDRLETRGLVQRNPSPHDRRSHALRLSEEGKALLLRLETMVAEHEREIARRLSEDEQQQLIRLLDRIGRGR